MLDIPFIVSVALFVPSFLTTLFLTSSLPFFIARALKLSYGLKKALFHCFWTRPRPFTAVVLLTILSLYRSGANESTLRKDTPCCRRRGNFPGVSQASSTRQTAFVPKQKGKATPSYLFLRTRKSPTNTDSTALIDSYIVVVRQRQNN